MNIDNIRDRLNEAGISTDDYMIGNAWEDRLCLVWDSNNACWEVFYQERGKKQRLRVFDNEEAACYNLYSELVQDYVMSMRLIPKGSQ